MKEMQDRVSSGDLDVMKKLQTAAADALQEFSNDKIRKASSAREFIEELSKPYLEVKNQLLNLLISSSQEVKVRKGTLSPNDLHNRFIRNQDEAGDIVMMKTQAYRDINAFIVNEIQPNLQKGGNFVLYGPVGIGKSFGLAMNVLELRQKSFPLVLYINNAAAANYSYMIKEFCYALQFVEKKNTNYLDFHKKMAQIGGSDNLQQIWDEILDELNPTKQENYLWNLLQLLKIFQKGILIIFDQAFSNSNNRGLDSFLNGLLKATNDGISVLTCCSRTPPDFAKPQQQDHLRKIETKFTIAQGFAFVKNILGDFIQKLQIDQGKLDRILEITSLIPYELSVVCEIVKEMNKEALSLNELDAKYMEKRSDEIMKIHDEFAKKDFDKDCWITYLTLSRLKCQISTQFRGPIDENLCCLEPKPDANDHQFWTLSFYHPLYEVWTYQYYFGKIIQRRDELLNNLHPSSKLKYEPSPSSRGCALEHYVIDQLSSLCMTHCRLKNRWLFCPYRSNGASLKSEYFSFQISDIGKFKVRDNCLTESITEFIKPYVDDFQKRKNEEQSKFKSLFNICGTKKEIKHKFSGKLFTPDSRYMDCFDLLFVDPNEMTIFLIQITSNIKTHKRSDKIFFEVLKKGNKNLQY